MKIIKLVAIFAILSGAFYLIVPQIPPVISVKNITPTYIFGNKFAVDVTVTNYTPRPKVIYLNAKDLTTSASIYVDYEPVPETKPNTPETSMFTLSIPPFGHETLTLSPTLTEISSDTQQAVSGSSSTLPLARGSHDFVVEFGGYVSPKTTFSVE